MPDADSLVDPGGLGGRYEHRLKLWYDGPYGGSLAFDRVSGKDVGLYVAYSYTDHYTFTSRRRPVPVSITPTCCR